jgi:O-antigen biosynthesis protein
MINIIVPVYKGIEETARCLNALKQSDLPDDCKVTIINDSSPEPEMAGFLEKFIKGTPFRLEKNIKNLGFVATINKGISLYPDHDVVLLNSDTEVPQKWLQRLSQCAYSAADIGTVTPFSNNATICSYPRFCTNNELPDGWDISDLDRLFQEANRDEIVDIPTAIGFCMFIKKDCLLETGLFDEKRFGRGYGEENDFCMRASSKGWRHVLCADLFVFHAGSVSFADECVQRSKQALSTINKLYPRYSFLVSSHINTDPAKSMRHRIDLLRIALCKRPVILFISHSLSGGVVKHEKELEYQFNKKAVFLRITPTSDNVIVLKWYHDSESLRLQFRIPEHWDALISCLKMLRVAFIHFHHLLDLPRQIRSLPDELAIPYDVTIHDYYMICPRIALINHKGNFCGEPDENSCSSCLQNSPPSQRNIRLWRNEHQSFLTGARRIFCPSHDVLNRFSSYFNLEQLTYAPHPEIIESTTSQLRPINLSSDEKLHILVIGGLSRHKGADLLEAAAKNAVKRNLPLEYILIGHAWRNLAPKPKTALCVWGKYQDKELQSKIKETQAHLVWFPALWPETYSYTLSAALIANLPIVAPNLGAFPERLSGRPWTWICPWSQPPENWNDFFTSIRENNFLTGTKPLSVSTFTSGINLVSFNWQQGYLSYPKKEKLEFNTFTNLIDIANRHSQLRLSFSRKLVKKIHSILLYLGSRLRSYPCMAPIARRVSIEMQYIIRHYFIRNK